MEQLINAATMPYYASVILFPLSAALLGIIVLIIVERFIVEGKEGAKKKSQINNFIIYCWNAPVCFRILL